jgi:Domain of unknown function (DUF4114)
MYCRTTLVRICSVAALGLALVAPAFAEFSPAGDAVFTREGRVAFPGLGEEVLANGQPVEIEILPAQSDCTSDIYLLVPFATVPVRQYLGTNREAGKRVVAARPFSRGEELEFEIDVRSSVSPPCASPIFTTGPGYRNPDGLAHAWVTFEGRTAVTVAFEDIFGGGDWDFNDVVFKVRMATPASGLDNFGLGGAELSPTGDGEVVVSHLSDSGQDGVGVSLGEATGWGFGLTSLDPSSGASTVTVTTRGRIGGVNNQSVATTRFEIANDGRLRQAADFSSLGASSVRFDLLDRAGQAVATFSGIPNGNLFDPCPIEPPSHPPPLRLLGFDWGFTQKIADFCCLAVDDPDCPFAPPICPGPEPRCFYVEYIRVQPENPTRTPDFLSEGLLTTTGVTSLAVAGEGVQFQSDGPLHRGLGGARLDAAAGTLTVSGLGTSGEDGVAIDPGGPSGSVGVVYSPFFPVPPPSPDGAFLELTARGVGAAASQPDLGSLRLAASGNATEVTADYSPVGSASQRILVLAHGEVVADVAGHSGPVASVAAWPTGSRSGRFDVDGRPVRSSGAPFGLGEPPAWGFRLDFAGDQSIDVPAGPTVTGNSVVVLAEAPAVPIGAISEVRLQGAQMPPITLDDEEVTPACAPDDRSLCLHGGRFRVEAAWRTPKGTSGIAHALQLTGDTGAFWFFQPDNLELVVKALDACNLADRFWVFAAGLTNVEVEMTVTDTLTGDVQRYDNSQRTPFAPMLDTSAFATCGISATRAVPSGLGASPAAGFASGAGDRSAGAGAQGGAPGDTGSRSGTSSLLLNGSRFQVEATWRTPQGRSGSGHPVQITEDTGYFWFFDPENVEVVVKALDACALADRFWLFAGGLTNVEVDLTVTDTQTGAVRRYHNPQRTPFTPILDTSAFDTCP